MDFNDKTLKRNYIVNFSILISLMVSIGSCNKQEPLSFVTPQSNQNEIIPIKTDVNMLTITGGMYLPFYSSNDSLVKVDSFLIDEHPVTNQDYLLFVKANPQWRRSQIKKIFEDGNYLKHWVNDTTLPVNSNPQAAICNVSWYAAKAYAKAVGKRLPTLDEWEFVAMADTDTSNARSKKSYSDNIVNLYLEKNRQLNPVKQSPANYWGVYNMFDLVWEWTDDFNSVLVSGESRAGEYGDKNLVCAAGATSATDVLNYAAFMRFGLRTSLKANYTVNNLGFRCAKDINH